VNANSAVTAAQSLLAAGSIGLTTLCHQAGYFLGGKDAPEYREVKGIEAKVTDKVTDEYKDRAKTKSAQGKGFHWTDSLNNKMTQHNDGTLSKYEKEIKE
jgi:hypothetical protein